MQEEGKEGEEEKEDEICPRLCAMTLILQSDQYLPKMLSLFSIFSDFR